MKMIDDFISTAKGSSKTALIYRRNRKWINKTFSEFLNDIFKMNSLIKEKVNDDNILVFSHPYKYEFYVTAFSVILSGKNLVIIDSFKDKNKLNYMIETASVKSYICDNITKYISFIFPKRISKIKSEDLYNYEPLELNKDSGKVITFTSGTTGNPKMITRNINFLFDQIKLVQENISYSKSELVYGLLPMYSLMSLFLGNTTIIDKNPNKVAGHNPTALITSIKAIQKIKKPLKTVEKAFIGGAILYAKEAVKLQNNLPNSEITYVYGASESAMIYKTTVSDFINNPFVFDKPIKGINISIKNPDANNVGEIVINGDMVIGENNEHLTGDLGILENGKLKIVGRKKYSQLGFYNYLIDEDVLFNNPNAKEAFSFVFKNKKYIVYRGKITNYLDGVTYKKVRAIPHDLKHKTKADYSKLIELIENL